VKKTLIAGMLVLGLVAVGCNGDDDPTEAPAATEAAAVDDTVEQEATEEVQDEAEEVQDEKDEVSDEKDEASEEVQDEKDEVQEEKDEVQEEIQDELN
jgi:hypothetical protein